MPSALYDVHLGTACYNLQRYCLLGKVPELLIMSLLLLLTCLIVMLPARALGCYTSLYEMSDVNITDRIVIYLKPFLNVFL